MGVAGERNKGEMVGAEDWSRDSGELLQQGWLVGLLVVRRCKHAERGPVQIWAVIMPLAHAWHVRAVCAFVPMYLMHLRVCVCVIRDTCLGTI